MSQQFSNEAYKIFGMCSEAIHHWSSLGFTHHVKVYYDSLVAIHQLFTDDFDENGISLPNKVVDSGYTNYFFTSKEGADQFIKKINDGTYPGLRAVSG